MFSSRLKGVALKSAVIAATLASSLSVTANSASAAAPVGATLDGTFGTAGIALNDFGKYDIGVGTIANVASPVTLVSQFNDSDFASSALVTRFTSAGALDTTYGVAGKRALVPGAGDVYASAIAAGTSGSALSAGYFGETPIGFVAKTTSSGALDTTFDTDGYKTDSSVDGFDSVIGQADGKVVAVGTKTDDNFDGTNVVARYLSTGALDTSFSGDGYVTFPGYVGIDPAAVDDGAGGIWVTGTDEDGTFVVRIDQANGNISFTKHIPGTDQLSDSDVYPVSTILGVPLPVGNSGPAGVWVGTQKAGHPLLAKLLPNGDLDSGFGQGGLSEALNGVHGQITAMTTSATTGHGSPTDRLTVGLYSASDDGTGPIDFLLSRLHSDGTVDGSFDNGGDGIVDTPMGAVGSVTSVGYTPGGKLLATGVTIPNAEADANVGLARYSITTGAPTAPLKVSTIGQNNGAVKVQWDYPASDGGLDMTGYRVINTNGAQVASVGGGAANATISGLTAATLYSFKVVGLNSAGTSPASAYSNQSYTTGSNTGAGYYLIASDGGVFSEGDAPFYGSAGAIKLNKPIVDSALTTSGQGYWLVASDGGVFSYGDATFKGSAGGIKLNQPIVGATPTPTGGGYWLVASDGGVFAYGDAAFYGSTGGSKLNKPIVDLFSTPTGKGYWLVASDGGIFAYGDANFFGSTGGIKLNKPIVGAVPTPSANGYWLVASDGGVFAYGDAAFYGSTGATKLNKPIIGVSASPSGHGYMMTASDGGVFAFGDYAFHGSTGNIKLNQPIVSTIRN